MVEPSSLLLDLFDKFGNCSQNCCEGTSSDCGLACVSLYVCMCNREVCPRALLSPSVSVLRLIWDCFLWWIVLCTGLVAELLITDYCLSLCIGSCSCTKDCVHVCVCSLINNHCFTLTLLICVYLLSPAVTLASHRLSGEWRRKQSGIIVVKCLSLLMSFLSFNVHWDVCCDNFQPPTCLLILSCICFNCTCKPFSNSGHKVRTARKT